MSSPTSEDGAITRQEAKCQVILRYFCVCPECKRLQTLEWNQVKFDDDHDLAKNKRIAHGKATSVYECIHCQAHIESSKKEWMLDPKNGAGWFPMDTEPDIVDNPMAELFKAFDEDDQELESIAFRLSSLYSPWLTWGDITEKFLTAHMSDIDRYDKLRAFRTDWLAEEWVDVVEKKTEHDILSHRCELPPMVIPAQAVALTAGVDCQRDSFWYCVRAWAQDGTSWVIDYGQIPTWEDVYNLLFVRRYRWENSDEQMGIWQAALDIGGGLLPGSEDQTMTGAAYQFISTRGGNKVFGIKGSSVQNPAQKVKPSTINKMPGTNLAIPGIGVRLLVVDVEYFKHQLHTGLQVEKGSPGAIYFHRDTDIVLARHILSEELRRDIRGRLKFKQVRGENHLLDAMVYAAVLVDPGCFGGLRRFEGLERRPLSSVQAPEPQPAQNPGKALTWPPPRRQQRMANRDWRPSWLKNR